MKNNNTQISPADQCAQLLEIATKAGPSAELPQGWWSRAYRAVEDYRRGGVEPAAPKKATDARHKAFIEWWVKRYPEVFGRDYVLAGAIDGSNLSRFLKNSPQTTISEMAEIAEAAWTKGVSDSKENFFCKHASTITGFCCKWNQILSELERGTGRSATSYSGGGF